MRTLRLLPVVVCAAGALLALKTVGLVSGGGYVLAGFGATAVLAQEAAGEGGVVQLSEPTAEDLSPTLADAAPTVEPAGMAETHGLSEGQVAAGAEAAEDVMPGLLGPDGKPLAAAPGGEATERVLLERLGERRAELDAYAAELDMRAALIEAAEKRIEERAATMQALEAQISTLVEERKAAEEQLVSGIVAMYEVMRPRDAAAIFNDLDMEVLLQVARTMPPRKMAPILAAMNPTRAQELTVRLAAARDEPADRMSADDFAALPQIVGE